jgi:DNA polymerase I-like protein with 3'-5' exonuclease and polymerase domains
MSVQECERFIQKYFARFPKVNRWIRDIKKFAKRNKYVETKTGRRRHLPAIDSSDNSVANEALRQAVNAPIQSTGSDCTLMSLILINAWLKENSMKSKICITVHDSIVLDVHKSEAIIVAKKVKDIMENLAKYHEDYSFLGDVPIVSEMEIGYSYGNSFECGMDLDDLEKYGIDNFLKECLDEKHAKEQKAYKEYEEAGKDIPTYVRNYWESKVS